MAEVEETLVTLQPVVQVVVVLAIQAEHYELVLRVPLGKAIMVAMDILFPLVLPPALVVAVVVLEVLVLLEM